MPKNNDLINKDNQKFLKEVKAAAKVEYDKVAINNKKGLARFAAKIGPSSSYNKGLKILYAELEAKLDGQPTGLLDYTTKLNLKKNLARAPLVNNTATFIELLGKQEGPLFTNCSKLVKEHISEDKKARDALYKYSQTAMVEIGFGRDDLVQIAIKKIDKLNANLHALDSDPKLKKHFLEHIASMGDKGQELLQKIASSKTSNLLGAIVKGANEEISVNKLIKLANALADCKTDLEAEMKAKFILNASHNLKGGFNDKNIDLIVKSFTEKPQMGWDEFVGKQSKEQQIKTAAYFVANYPGLCSAIRKGFGNKITNEQLIKAVAQIAIESEIMYTEQRKSQVSLDHEKQFELKEKLLARLESKIEKDPVTAEAISDVLKVNHANKANAVDKKVAKNLVIAADHPNLFKELERVNPKVAKTDTPAHLQLEDQLIGLQENLRKKLPDEMKGNKHVQPLALAEDYVKKNKGGLEVLEGSLNPFKAELLDAHKEKASNKHALAEKKRRESQVASPARQ